MLEKEGIFSFTGYHPASTKAGQDVQGTPAPRPECKYVIHARMSELKRLRVPPGNELCAKNQH